MKRWVSQEDMVKIKGISSSGRGRSLEQVQLECYWKNWTKAVLEVKRQLLELLLSNCSCVR